MADQDEVVISGIGGFFPKASNLEEFKTRLLSNEILLETRWKEGERGVSNKLGKCPTIEYFDTAFFGIHRQQSTFMDPMQRLVLERTFEALVDAGVNPQDLRGKRIGVFMGSCIGENDNIFYESIVSGFGVTGHSRAMMANRVSYWLNLKGPSCAYDSSWISGIEVLQMGFDAVRDGHCESAIIGTANMALNSELSWLYNDMGYLSADGSTRAFDADATGYARSDGIVVMYIQRAADAIRSYATIIGTATQFNGYRDSPLLDVDQPSMVKFMKDFYAKCNVNPHDVDFVECYGAALKRIDEPELNSIDEVYCKDRKKPLMVGCVKTNTGHSEASANLFSVAKVIVAMETGKIPATLQYSKPNPNIEGLVKGRIEVPTENRDWDGEYMAVNGISMTSAYAHCLLKANPKKKKLIKTDLPTLIVTSTRTETGVQTLLDTVKGQPTFDPEYIAIIHELYSKTIPGHLYRGYSVMEQNTEIKRDFGYFPGNKRPIWFVFSGMGSQWAGMGIDLLKLPIAAESLRKSHKALEPYGIDVLKIITDLDPHIYDNILHSFVGIAAVQIALTDILRALGVTPDGIIGHSVGELGCAYADGALTAEQMMLCAYSRGKASLDASLIEGMMAAIGMGYQQMKDLVPESIEVACHNSGDSCTISGPTADMEKYVQELQDKGTFARLVNVSNIAYHSRYIKPAAPLLLSSLKKVIPEALPRSSKWISTSVPESNWNSDLAKTCSAEYHTNNLLSSVLFEEGSRHIPKEAIAIEIAPHGLLQAILKRSLGSGCTNIPLTQRGSKNGVHFLLGAIGSMHLAGIDVQVAKIFPSIEYPVSKGTVGLAPLVDWEHSETWRTGLEDKLNYLVSVKDLKISTTMDEYKDCVGHQLDDRIVLPLSTYLMVLIRILATSKSIEISDVIFENVRFRNIVTVPKVGSVPLYGMVQRGSGDFEVLSGEEIIATGTITVPQPNDKIMFNTYDFGTLEGCVEISSSDIYNEFSHRGHNYTGFHKGLKKITLTKEGSLAVMSGNNNWQHYLEGMLQQKIFLTGERNQNLLTPIIVQRINLSMPNIPKSSDDVVLSHDYSTGVIHMNGLQMRGVTLNPIPVNPKAISFDTVEFVPLTQLACDNIESVINYSIKIVMNNFSEITTNNIIITEIVNKYPSVLQNIKNVLLKYTQLQANVTSVSDPKIQIITQTDPILLVSSDELQEDTVKSLLNFEGYALVKTSSRSHPQIISVAQFRVNETNYSLVRQYSNKMVKCVNVTGNSLTANDLTKDNLGWVTELKSRVSKMQATDCVYLISNLVPIEGISNFVQELHARKEYVKLRFLFVLDKKAPSVDASETYYETIFQQEHLCSVLKNGIVGTYLSIPVEFKENLKSDFYFSSNSIGDHTLLYLGVNRDNETMHATNVGLGNVDYVAKTKDNKRVMGLAQVDPDNYSLVPNDALTWDIPNSWSDEEACTIPQAYAVAYHALIQKAELDPTETVLIHAGCSAIGLASIAIAGSMGCNVFVSVATEWQKKYLKKQFSFLKDRNLLWCENTSFEQHLLNATNGKGAHVILNVLNDSLLRASVRCLAEFGRLLQLGRFDKKQNNTIGMNVFLKNTSLIGIVPEFLFDLCDEDKQELTALLLDGIAKSVVRPLNRKVVEHQPIGSILTSLQETNHIGKVLLKLTENWALSELNINKPHQFICNPKASNLVYGGTGETCLDMLEWLVLRGARKILICSDFKPQTSYIKRRLSMLHTYFNAVIIHRSNKLQTKEHATELLSELYTLGPIEGAYVLPTPSSTQKMSDVKIVQYLELALRSTAPKAAFLNFVPNFAGICQNREEAGFRTYNIQYDNDLDSTVVLFGLDDILSYKSSNTFIKNDNISNANQETPQVLYKKMNLMLPVNIPEMISQAMEAPDELEIVQLPSGGPRRIRELPPVIIVPGVYDFENVRKLAMELLYPVFYTEMPNKFIPIGEAAKIFAMKIRNLYKRGPYNIVGLSWGGALAIEIGKILQQYSYTQVTLVDGAPDTIKAVIKQLGEGTGAEVNLLNRVLNINNNEFLKRLGELPDWNARLREALDKQKLNDNDKDLLKVSLDVLKQKLSAVSKYKSSEELLNGEIYLIRPIPSSKFDTYGLEKYFKQTPLIHLSTGDHVSILLADNTLDVINENVAT